MRWASVKILAAVVVVALYEDLRRMFEVTSTLPYCTEYCRVVCGCGNGRKRSGAGQALPSHAIIPGETTSGDMVIQEMWDNMIKAFHVNRPPCTGHLVQTFACRIDILP